MLGVRSTCGQLARQRQYGSVLLGASTTTRSMSRRTVRVICLQDLPYAKAYKDDVVKVKPGYARNYLIPKKMALYATRQNFERVGLVDPDQETAVERRARLSKEATDEADVDLKAADILRKYFFNKELTIWRKVEAEEYEVPLDRMGVNARIVKEKLAKQLKIDLEDHEPVCIAAEPLPISFDELYETGNEEQLEKMLEDMGDKDVECPEIRKLGNYIVRIWLRGDHLVPLKLILARKP